MVPIWIFDRTNRKCRHFVYSVCCLINLLILSKTFCKLWFLLTLVNVFLNRLYFQTEFINLLSPTLRTHRQSIWSSYLPLLVGQFGRAGAVNAPWVWLCLRFTYSAYFRRRFVPTRRNILSLHFVDIFILWLTTLCQQKRALWKVVLLRIVPLVIIAPHWCHSLALFIFHSSKHFYLVLHLLHAFRIYGKCMEIQCLFIFELSNRCDCVSVLAFVGIPVIFAADAGALALFGFWLWYRLLIFMWFCDDCCCGLLILVWATAFFSAKGLWIYEVDALSDFLQISQLKFG